MAGQTATHTVALCNLIIDGSNKGLHWFIVPLRLVLSFSIVIIVVSVLSQIVWKKKKKDLFTFTSEWLMIDTIPTQEH
jgi:hypothetical protein